MALPTPWPHTHRERVRLALSLCHTHCRYRSVLPHSGCQSNRMRYPNNGWYTVSQQSTDFVANRTYRSIPRWHSRAWWRPVVLWAADRMQPSRSWVPHCECSRQTILWYIWHHAASPPTRGLWILCKRGIWIRNEKWGSWGGSCGFCGLRDWVLGCFEAFRAGGVLNSWSTFGSTHTQTNKIN